MREIVPGIFEWPWFAERFRYDFHGYYLPEFKLAIDPVAFPDSLSAVETIAITNRNHFREAQKLKDKTGARVLVHPADRAFVESKDVVVDGDLPERVGPFTVVPAPGKSPGEVALHWPERRLLLIGDACVGPSPGVLGLLPDAVIDDKPRLLDSLRALAALDVETILLCDGHIPQTRAALETLISR
jgi:glyoxylase-like metal-dependent hydrolase (beta-lactamase superfamily II)